MINNFENEIVVLDNSFDKIKYNVKKLSISKKLNNLGYKVC